MTKNSSAPQAYLLYAALFVLSYHTSTAKGSSINIINKCSFGITAYLEQKFEKAPQSFKNKFLLGPGDNATVKADQKSDNYSIWASSSNNEDYTQATDLSIYFNAIDGQDYYNIDNTFAYNLPTQIQPLGRPSCKVFSCTIKNLAGFCQPPNKYGSVSGTYGEYCINTAGLGNVSTAGTRAFKARCPDAQSYRGDREITATTTICPTGGDYNFIYCP